jgi:hypothetical protein
VLVTVPKPVLRTNVSSVRVETGLSGVLQTQNRYLKRVKNSYATMRQRNNNGYTYSTLVASLVIQLVVLLVFSNPVVSISQPCGSLQCENGGKCMDLSITATSSSSLSNIQASVKPILQCLCPPGYGGVTCSYYHGKLCSEDEAGEAATCSNGSCIPNPLNSNVTECPCDIAYSISPLAGQMCESPETEYCLPVWSHQPSRQFFCTNGGRCFGGGSSSTTIQEESDTWGTVLSDTPFTCQCRKSFPACCLFPCFVGFRCYCCCCCCFSSDCIITPNIHFIFIYILFIRSTRI